MQTKKILINSVTGLIPLVYLLFCLLFLKFSLDPYYGRDLLVSRWVLQCCLSFAVWGSYSGPLFLLKPETKKRNTTYSSSPSKDFSCLLRPPNLITYNLTIAIVSFREHWSPLCIVADLQIIVSIIYTEQSCSMRVLLLLW